MARYLILGSGPAGVAAAQAIRSQDAQSEVVLVGHEPFGYYSRPGLAYYLSGEIPEDGLFPIQAAEFQSMGVRQLQAEAVAIDPAGHQVQFKEGQRLTYDRLLLAVGAEARHIRAPGSDLEGVVKLDTLADARQILKLARKAKAAVVVGGGITALEIVEGLSARKVQAHYFLRKDRYWANVLDETESQVIQDRLEEEGVRLHFHTDLAAILGKRGRVRAVQTEAGREIPCQLVAVAIGIQPRLELAKSAGLQVERGVLVDEYLRSSAADIFAAGDVAQVYDPASGQHVLDSLWDAARGQGHAAGLNMTGLQTPYLKPVPFNVTRLAGLTTTIIGTVGRGDDPDLKSIMRGDSETWRQLPDAIVSQTGFSVNQIRLLVGEQRLLGAIVMGDQTLSQALHHLVRDRADISPIRDQLIQPGADLVETLVDFWTTWRKNHGTQQS
ncbi:MAG: NAD(P)/FAD-dependent oxidoreductase [Anaerolineales bacterium]|nr:NAD(P)/FAD-dependent oxidoreductase [Anaerolineales bacterium]